MELKLEQGAYVQAGNGFVTVSGPEELAQRVMMRLTARRGGFAPLPQYGSRLYLLSRTAKPGQYETAEMQYIAEALEEEPGVTVQEVTVTSRPEGTLQIDAVFSAEGFSFSGNLTV